LIPLQLTPANLVLIGDPQQLSCTVVHSQAAAAAGIQRSMMERLMLAGQCECNLLEEQYRMAPEISRFVSARFYQGRLIDAQSPSRAKPLLKGLPPYVVLDVAGTEVMSKGGIHNPDEAAAVLLFLEALIPAAAARKQQVACITFYACQAAFIRRRLHVSHADAFLGVHTVDSFQGSEADIIVLSFVRANSGGRVGFLSDFRRLNVALSRAKRHLVILANVNTFRSLGNVNSADAVALFQDARDRGVLQSFKEGKCKFLKSSDFNAGMTTKKKRLRADAGNSLVRPKRLRKQKS